MTVVANTGTVAVPRDRRFKDLTGKRFGKWTVRHYLGKRGKVPYWWCACDCGNEDSVCGWNLNRGLTLSCGCNHREDLTGWRFGRLLVMAYGGGVKYACGNVATWRCLCTCGKSVTVFANSLKSGRTQSCGCYHAEVSSHDLTGRVFDRLQVIAKADRRGRNGSLYWHCRCRCGKEFAVSSKHLLSGNTRSCGCLSAEMLAKRSFKHGLSYTKEYQVNVGRIRRERERKVNEAGSWTAAMTLLLAEMQPRCVVCGSGDRLAIDHVNPLSKGHALKPGNAVRLCQPCNNKKWVRTLDELPVSWRIRIRAAARSFERAWNQRQAEGAAL